MTCRIFNKDILRSIKDSFGRFIAITLIAALGCGFYAGLKTTSPDMLLSADRYYDDSNLMDIRVVATLGLTDEDIDDIGALDGVAEVFAAYETDAMADIGEEQCAVRIHSLENGVNGLSLAEGHMPEAADECVLSADTVMGSPAKMGDTVEISEELVEDSLSTRSFKIVGFVHSPYYVSSASMGSTSLGTGTINQYMYVTDAAFGKDFPITEAFVLVSGAKDEMAGSDAYQEKVDAVASEIEEISDACEKRRVESIRSDAQQEVDDARAELEGEEKKADEKLASAKEELDSAKEKLDSGARELADSKAKYQKGLKEYESGKANSEKRLESAQKKIDSGEKELEQAKEQLAAQKSEFEASKPYMSEKLIAATEAKLEQAQEKIDEEQDNLASAKASLKKARSDAKSQLSASKKRLDDAKKRIESGEQELEEGKKAYESGLQEYEDAKEKAEREIADGRRKIDDAQKEVDDLGDLEDEWLVLDRTKNLGVESFSSDAERVDNIAQIFPLIFFLVAALVALTTMTRMVEEDRMIIGTFKALGYSRARITSKYMLYALAASGIGAVIGIVALSLILPGIIMEAYAIIYYVPHDTVMPLDISVSALSAALGVGITLISTWFACAATLRESPASLMLPRTPHAGKPILLERIKPIWSRLSFLWKVTFRNIFRYKKRFFMTLIGIAGCTALLLTGLGLQDSINDIIDKQFGVTVKYNVTIDFDDAEDADTKGPTVQDMLEDSAYVQLKSVCPIGPDGTQGYATLVVPEDIAAFDRLWILRERVGGAPIEFGDGAIIDEKLANTLGLKKGDELVIANQDEMGNATNSRKTVTVDGIMENYVSDYIFMSPSAYEAVYGKAPEFSSILGVGEEAGAARDALTDALHDVPGVKTVAFNDDTIDTYKTMLKSVNMIVVVLVVSAAALAFIVLYNLTNINITERKREIATLKVLGFTRKEVYLYIFREILMLTVIGALAGLLLGIVLEGFVVVTAEVDHVMFGRDIHPLSFVWGFALTLVFSIMVMLFMRRRLDRIDMVESLKSIE